MSRWYKRNGLDFIHGTMNLTLEEKGAYSLCLDLIYDRAGPIPDDARWLSGICGISMRKWNAIRQSLIGHGKLTAENGLLMNVRAGFELVSSELSRRNFAEAGARGGRKRAENEAAARENNDLAQASLNPPFKQSREEEIREEESPPTPPSGRAKGKTLIPEDWQLPEVDTLPPKARACAEQWTRASYETHGEAFVCYWQGRRGMNADWRLTWANRVVAMHGQVMRDQKFGNAPTGNGGAKGRLNVDELRAAISYREDHGDEAGAAEYREQLAALVPPP